MIYFVQACLSPRLIKVGFCQRDRLPGRLYALRNMSPVQLVLIALMEGEKDAEAKWHHEFTLYRAWGEWFEPAYPVLSFIHRLPFHPYQHQVRLPSGPPIRWIGQRGYTEAHSDALRRRITRGQLPFWEIGK